LLQDGRREKDRRGAEGENFYLEELHVKRSYQQEGRKILLEVREKVMLGESGKNKARSKGAEARRV